LVAVPRASAHDFDDRGRCEERVERAQAKLNRAIWQHGFYSRQAEHQRHELQEARERCWRENRGWNGRGRQWRNGRDWDHDGDRDRR
jgi:hypothetical protein